MLTLFSAAETAVASGATSDPYSPFVAGIVSLGGFGLLLILLLTGRLKTKSDYDERTKERDGWRTAYEQERQNRVDDDKYRESTVEQGKTIIHLIESLQDGVPSRRERR